MIRVSLPKRRSFDHSADVVHQIGVAAQPSSNPSHEPDVLLRKIALPAQVIEPAVGVAIENPHQNLVAEEIGRRGMVTSHRERDDIARKRAAKSVQTGVRVEYVFDATRSRRFGTAEGGNAEGASAIADGAPSANADPGSRGSAAPPDFGSAAGLVNE